ncbi:MAG: VCBS repeat-containing protein [Nannocystis sp.]|nr:FG-GAP-like repeat-containing protein [Nannocystis sp.]MBA3546269.1 VCBS repeat-containing protein [Nannocystis sp.]
MHHSRVLRLLAAVFALSAPVLAHADTSATLATAINIPKGPASIEGFGRAYEVSPASGLPSLSYPLEVPPGRAGHAPQLALHYHAGGGAGVLGLGWSLDLPAIERSSRAGIPRGDISPAWQLRHLGDGEELTETAPGIFRQRIEQGAPIVVRTLPGGAMSALATDGTGYLFGLTADARLVGDAGPVRLEISAITDVHGNRIDFYYTRAAGSDAPLLSAITWNDGQARVDINYEARPDLLVSHATGQRLALTHRITAIRTEVAGEPVRTTTLTYARSTEAPSSRLSAIATVAADGAALPTWRMTYTGEAATPIAHDIPGAPALDPTTEGRAWVDVDGDALPDLLEGEPGAWRFRKNIGDTRLAATWTALPSPAVLLAPATRFADLTGDGIQDLLAQPSPGELWRFIGGGQAPFGTAESIALDLSFDLSDPRVALADMNLDGRVDVLRHDDSDGWIWRQHRDAAGYEPAEAVPPPPAGMRLGDPGVQLADMNGDRIPDLVRILSGDSRILVAAGAGLGFFEDPADMTDAPAMMPTDRWELADINGDGAADLVRIGANQLGLWINQLDGSFAEAAAAPWPPLEADEVVLVTDIDGSGTLDILRADTDGSQPWRAWSLFPERPGLLARFENGLGYTREHTYRPAAQLAAADAAAGVPWTTAPPEAMPVLTETREDDGAGWTSTLHRGLRDGWYDPARGAFRGFAELRDETTGDPYTEAATIIRSYDLGQSDEARGLQLLAAETRSPRGVLVREAHTLAVDTPAKGVRAVRRTASDTYHLEAGPESAAERVRTEWDHDEWANVLEERAFGRVDRKTGADLPGDERITTYVYATPSGEDGPRDRISEQIVMDADGAQLTAIRTYYDGEPEQGLPLRQLAARGIVARTETWLKADTWVATLRQTVDARGNIIRVRDAEDGTLERRYDTGGLFPVEERLLLPGDALITTAEWDPRIGHPLAITAPSGATTRATYDGLGRLVAEILPGDTAELPTTRHRYFIDGSAPHPSILTEMRRISGEPDVDLVAAHLDGLGRPRLRVTQDDTGTAAILAEAKIYSGAGAVAEIVEGQPLPAAALLPGAVVAIADAWPRSLTHTDALGRVIFTRDADSRETVTTYGPLWTEHHDHEDLHPTPPYQNTPERSEQDGLGRTIARKQLLTDRTIIHAYAHDAAGRLTATIDPAGHRTTFTRDGAGRLTRIDSPDAGRLRQRFDRTGRVTERIDATSARITWAFDPLGRLLHERAYNPAGAPTGEVRHHYDGSGPFARGQLARVDDDAGHVEFTYDARGRIVTSTRTFDASNGPITLTAGQVYDAQDRILRDIYPDGSTLEHDYSPRGLERPLDNFIKDVEYDALARWREVKLPSGITLHRDLDHSGRVQGQRVTAGSRTLLDLAHRYDAAGQLAETRDDLTAENFSLSQTFIYDDLRRLVGHTAAGKTQTWRYSDDGNLLEHAGHVLGYDEARPHAAVSLDAQALSYDAAGQLADIAGNGSIPAGAWRFDPHGRVQSFTATDGRRVEHVHGYTGERAIRREYDAAGQLAQEVLYFTRNLEVRDGKLVRWVYFAGERLAESPLPLPAGGFPELPAEAVTSLPLNPRHGPNTLALLLGMGLLLLLGLLTTRPRRLLVSAAALALVSSTAALSCHSNPARTLTPDEHTRFHVADRLGSAALVLDHRGRVLTRDAADPYGIPRLAWRADDDTAAPTYRFTGKEDDALSGAIAMGARHYLPQLGRWASPDPHFLLENPDAALSTPGEANPYGYVGGNPVTFTDPTGRKGLAHGSENRPGVLDNYPDSPNPGFKDRMAAVARDRAVAQLRNAQLASMALGVLDAALTGLDWAMTASDIADTAALFTGVVGAGIKLTKQTAKAGVRQLRTRVRVFAKNAMKDAEGAAHNLANFGKLKKDLASQQQMGELKDTAEIMAGKGGRVPIRDAPRLSSEHGGAPEDWSKIRSSNYKAEDGTSFETHAYRNETTGQVVEAKTKFQ